MMTNQDGSMTNEFMQFLQRFQASLETKMEDTKTSIETSIDKNNAKIDFRLGNIDEQVSKLNLKIVDTEEKIDEVSTRMDRRLNKLEEEMRKSTILKRKSDELRDIEQNLNIQPAGSAATKKDICQDKFDKVKQISNTILNEPVGTLRSSWAQNIQLDPRPSTYQASNLSNDTPAIQQHNSNDKDNTDYTPEHWEELHEDSPAIWEKPRNFPAKQKNKIRKPPTITSWFGNDDSTEEDDSTDDTSWSNVDRRRRSLEKKKRASKKK